MISQYFMPIYIPSGDGPDFDKLSTTGKIVVTAIYGSVTLFAWVLIGAFTGMFLGARGKWFWLTVAIWPAVWIILLVMFCRDASKGRIDEE